MAKTFPIDEPQVASFFMGGFECTYALIDENLRIRLDILAGSKHDALCREDYRLLKAYGIKTVREGLAWHQIDRGQGVYDFSRFEKMLQAGQEEGMQQVWDLNHFDYPEDLNAYSPEFITRFAAYAKESLKVLRRYITGTLYIVPLNEISFYTYIAASEGHWAPFKNRTNSGVDFKHQLVRASIAAMNAIAELDNDVRFIQVEPVMVRRPFDPNDQKASAMAQEFNDVARFQAWDMLAGKVNPELGGGPKYLDIVGVNYYAVNQEWIVQRPNGQDYYNIMIPSDDPAHTPFTDILQQLHDRYQRPMVIMETGSHGEYRYSWWKKVLREIEQAMSIGLPVSGVCAYPILDKPDSTHFLWPQSGLWDFYQLNDNYERRPHYPALDVIEQFIKKHP